MGETRYILFIDGRFFRCYRDKESALKDCYCGDVFTIYECKLIEKIDKTISQEKGE